MAETSQKKREQLERETSVLNMAVMQSMDGVAITDLEGNITYTNLAWALMHGYYQSEVRGSNISCFLGSSPKPTEGGVVDILKEQGCYSGEYMNIRKDKTTFPVLLSANVARDDVGELVGMVFLIRDITEMKRFQEELKTSKDNFQKIIMRAAEGIVIVDATGSVLFVNPSALRMFAREENDIVGEEFGVPLVEGEMTEISIIRGSGELGTAEMRIVSTEWNYESAHLVLITDITELRRVQEALKEYESTPPTPSSS